MDDSSHPLLDMDAFNSLAELMGSNLAMLLESQIALAKGYIQEFNNAFEAGNFKAISETAHTFKSSSQQIGAMKVATLAKEIEMLAKATAPDINILKDLVAKITQAQEETNAILLPHINRSKGAI
jgi:HPt (histidine-containing phosphotransfer) domain-containing protein